ncbi:IS200/IS605 family transposase [Nonomuraea purpurea]|uniref:IS200/IS605 family transposase n=1 Tax=Nonomuraea purpurea TaxID=1849276 RepID=A0ABV8GCC1_9ACTN
MLSSGPCRRGGKPKPDVRRSRTVVCSLHTAFTPMWFHARYRCDVFTDEIPRRCEDVMLEVCDTFGAILVDFNGEHDHVHPLVRHPSEVALSVLVNSLKGVSSRLLRKEFGPHVRRYLRGGHFWPTSYLAASCGGAPLSIIEEYIENQKRPG